MLHALRLRSGDIATVGARLSARWSRRPSRGARQAKSCFDERRHAGNPQAGGCDPQAPVGPRTAAMESAIEDVPISCRFGPEMAAAAVRVDDAPLLHRSRVLTRKAFSPYNRGLFSPWQPGIQIRVAAEAGGRTRSQHGT